jgi:hypothetical protein
LPSGFKTYNKLALEAATHMPGENGAKAQKLLTMINDLTSEVATMYSGGNASTDDKLRLAGENLKGDWNEKQFRSNLDLLRQNTRYRYNSILNSPPAGVTPGSPYIPQEERGTQGGLTPSPGGASPPPDTSIEKLSPDVQKLLKKYGR